MNKVKKFFVFAKSSTLCVYSSICSDSHFVLGIPDRKWCTVKFSGRPEDKWVGMNNYKRLLSDTYFRKAVWNSFKYMVGTLVLLIPFPMLFASMLNSKLMKAKGIFQVCLFYPGTDICCRCRYNLPSDVW